MLVRTLENFVPRTLVLLVGGLLAGGCATAYHNYPCGCVHYKHCPSPPLPYTTYCGCPTPVAKCYEMVSSKTTATPLERRSAPELAMPEPLSSEPNTA